MKKNILIFPAGAENALEIYDALKYNVNIEVYGASGKKDYAEYKYPPEKYIEGDFYINKSDFNDKFQSVLSEYKIDIVIPTHDQITLYLAENRDFFSAKILVSSVETAKICREKKLMYHLISDMEFCPKVFDSVTQVNESDLPVFVKPNIGAGAVGTAYIDKINEIKYTDNYIITEYLPGEELSVDCFTNRKGELLFAGARSRDRIRMGIAFRSTTVAMTDEIYQIASVLNERLDFFGAWYFQIKRDATGKFKLLEVSCRQSGTMTLYRHMGINFPILGIFELLGIDTSFVLNEGSCQLERCLHTSFHYSYEYEKIYIDFDDTIIVNGEVCPVIIQFIYQCINKKKKIILLTRHDGDLYEELKKYRLADSLFDQIYHMGFDQKKKDYVSPEFSIFIDNSYQERKEIYDQYRIPVFDVDMVDMLIER